MNDTEAKRTEPALGLRERKKQTLRGEMSLAALYLAKKHGLANVRIEDIVAAVGVSRRTFSNYFANKYEAIADRLVERAQLAAEELRTRPHSETLWQALTAAILAPYEALADAFDNRSAEERRSTMAVLEEPLLRAELWKANLASQQALAQAIAERVGADPSDLYPPLVAATALAASMTALERWLRVKRPQPLTPLIREALELTAQGLPEPARRQDDIGKSGSRHRRSRAGRPDARL